MSVQDVKNPEYRSRHRSGGARSHTTKRGSDTQVATGHMSRRLARAGLSWAASRAL